MPGKRDPIGALAASLVGTLEALRQGGGPYPLTLRQLAARADPHAGEDLVRKAAARRKPFGERVLVGRPRDLDVPVALAEDRDRLAADPLLLRSALESACSAESPAWEPSRLRARVSPPLREAFAAALARRLRDGDLPPGVGAFASGKKTCLYLERYPPPPPPEVVLAENLVLTLQGLKARGPAAYPVLLSRLVELTPAAGDAKLLKKALAQPAFRESAQLAARIAGKRKDTPVALKADFRLLLGSAVLLEFVLGAARTETSQAFRLSKLKAPLDRPLQSTFEAVIEEGVRSRSLPAGIGSVREGGKLLLFRMRDVVTGAAGAASVPAPAPLPSDPRATPEDPRAFARDFDEAFERLDREGGAHNFVSLVDLRRRLARDRSAFDACLRDLRRAGRYTLSAADGRHGFSPEQQEAGIREDGSLLLYVSKRLS